MYLDGRILDQHGKLSAEDGSRDSTTDDGCGDRSGYNFVETKDGLLFAVHDVLLIWRRGYHNVIMEKGRLI